MDEFEYLDKQFRRLNEARHYMAKTDKSKGEKAMAENWMLAVKFGIKDFLELRQSKGADHG